MLTSTMQWHRGFDFIKAVCTFVKEENRRLCYGFKRMMALRARARVCSMRVRSSLLNPGSKPDRQTDKEIF